MKCLQIKANKIGQYRTNILIALIIFIVSFMGAKETYAHGAFYFGPPLYENEGIAVVPAGIVSFVLIIPAFWVDTMGYGIAKLLGKEDAYTDKYEEFIIKSFCYTGGFIAGFPFYAIKKVCFDFPKWIFVRDIKND